MDSFTCRDCHQKIVQNEDGSWTTESGEMCLNNDLHDA